MSRTSTEKLFPLFAILALLLLAAPAAVLAVDIAPVTPAMPPMEGTYTQCVHTCPSGTQNECLKCCQRAFPEVETWRLQCMDQMDSCLNHTSDDHNYCLVRVYGPCMEKKERALIKVFQCTKGTY